MRTVCLTMKRMKTYSMKAGEIDKRWHVVNAEGETLGRLAARVAGLLTGKHKPTSPPPPDLDRGDFVVVGNAEKVRVTGNKMQDKKYYRHTGYMGGLKTTTLGAMMQRQPGRVIEAAVRGMLPRNRLSRHVYRHLKVYAGPDHPPVAQITPPRKREAASAAASSSEK